MGGYILILVFLAVLWFLIIRPQRRRQTDAQRLVASLAVGKEIVTAGGLYGTITALEEDEARVQIADGVEVRIANGPTPACPPDAERPEDPEGLGEKARANFP